MHFVLKMFNIETLNSWFGFSRRERRSAAILLYIIIVIIAFRFLLPEKTITISEYPLNSEMTNENKANTYAKADLYQPADANRLKAPNKSYRLTSVGISTEKKYYKPVSTKQSGSGENAWQQNRELIELNRSDSAALVSLPGIGPVLSSRIIKFRNLIGGYATVDQLREVYGLPEETFILIRDRVYADTTLLRFIQINAADYRTLSRFPYLEKPAVSAILKYRELKGKINSISDLTENKLIDSEKAEKIRPYLRFD
jgi:DNA uptake protein ComE-like DNA-binding protein